jgi:hypothetical protein
VALEGRSESRRLVEPSWLESGVRQTPPIAAEFGRRLRLAQLPELEPEFVEEERVRVDLLLYALVEQPTASASAAATTCTRSEWKVRFVLMRKRLPASYHVLSFFEPSHRGGTWSARETCRTSSAP